MEPTQFIASNMHSLRPGRMTCGVACLAFISGLASAAPQTALNVKAQIQAGYGKLPLSFEANQGQTDARVKFLARGQGYALFLTPTEAVLSLKKSKALDKASAPAESALLSGNSEAVLRMQMVGSNPSPRIMGKEALPGRVNYLIGKDPAKWRTSIPTYGKVAYEGVYPGVDLVYYGNQGKLEYDFVVAPGVDPHDIKLAFKGSGPIEISPEGELVLHTENGAIRMHKPVVYQEINGIRKPIDGSYMLKEKQTVGFQIAAYDTAHPLIIDPVLAYSTYLGGTYMDDASSIAVDLQGRIYVTGRTSSTDFPALNSVQPNLSSRAGNSNFPVDAFVAQLTPDGTALRYATFLGGSELDISVDIVVDPQGQATVAGLTLSPDFPIHNALQPAFGGREFDVFVAQLTADGAALRYSTYLGGSKEERVDGIAVDRRGQVVLAGFTRSTDFPIKNALQPTFGGGFEDGFVTQLTADGALSYSTYLGGSDIDESLDIAVDPQDRAYVTGWTSSSNFPTKNALQPAFHFSQRGSRRDAFVAQLTANGKALRYSTYLGGNGDDEGSGIAVDRQGQVYVVGETNSTDFPTHHALQSTPGGDRDTFVTQLTADGAALRYSTYLGGSASDVGKGIAVDQRGRVSVTGYTDSANFPTYNALQPAYGGNADAFVAQFTADGRMLRYSTYLGGSGLDRGSGIAVDPQEGVYVVGYTGSRNFPTVNALQPAFNGNGDAFVAKIRDDGRP